VKFARVPFISASGERQTLVYCTECSEGMPACVDRGGEELLDAWEQSHVCPGGGCDFGTDPEDSEHLLELRQLIDSVSELFGERIHQAIRDEGDYPRLLRLSLREAWSAGYLAGQTQDGVPQRNPWGYAY